MRVIVAPELLLSVWVAVTARWVSDVAAESAASAVWWPAVLPGLEASGDVGLHGWPFVV
jgi:hypothetical protein